MKNMELSETMRAAFDYAKVNGGVLVRYPGGFWAKQGWRAKDQPWFGAGTVEGLVRRGVAVYTQHQTGRNGSFPVRAKLVPN